MDWRTGYLRQAKADYDLFQRLANEQELNSCYRLHLLQMATEKLAKGLLTLPGAARYPSTHDAFVNFVTVAKTRRDVRLACGFSRRDAYAAYIDSLRPQAQAVEDLSPEGEDHPNPEYPWVAGGNVISPLDYPFREIDLQSPKMIKLLRFIEDCLTLV